MSTVAVLSVPALVWASPTMPVSEAQESVVETEADLVTLALVAAGTELVVMAREAAAAVAQTLLKEEVALVVVALTAGETPDFLKVVVAAVVAVVVAVVAVVAAGVAAVVPVAPHHSSLAPALSAQAMLACLSRRAVKSGASEGRTCAQEQ